MEADDLLRYAAEVCDQLGLMYLVTGSTATIAYGEPRFTNDIDIVIELPTAAIEKFCSEFPSPEFYLSSQAVEEAVRRGSQFNLIHPSSGLKIDFIVLTNSKFDQSRLARRRNLPALPDRLVSFASPEDVIIKKMVYFREGGSQKHLRDIGGVLRIRGNEIDRKYVEEWAQGLGVEEIWQQILANEAESS